MESARDAHGTLTVCETSMGNVYLCSMVVGVPIELELPVKQSHGRSMGVPSELRGNSAATPGTLCM